MRSTFTPPGSETRELLGQRLDEGAQVTRVRAQRGGDEIELGRPHQRSAREAAEDRERPVARPCQASAAARLGLHLGAERSLVLDQLRELVRLVLVVRADEDEMRPPDRGASLVLQLLLEVDGVAA